MRAMRRIPVEVRVSCKVRGEWRVGTNHHSPASGILRELPMGKRELNWAEIPARACNIPASLSSGQTFRWRQAADGDWLGVVANSAVRLRPEEKGFWWQTYPAPNRFEVIQRYFALDVELEALYAYWLEREPRI